MGKITNIVAGILITGGAGFGSYQKAVESYTPKTPPPNSYDILISLVSFNDPLASIGALFAFGLALLSIYQVVTALSKKDVVDVVQKDGDQTRKQAKTYAKATDKRLDDAEEQRWEDREAADRRENEAKAERSKIQQGISNFANDLIKQNQELAAAKGISDDRLIRLANRVVHKVEDPADAADYLHGALDRLQELEAEGARGTNFGGLIDQVIAEIFTAIDEEDIGAARAKGDAAFAQFQEQEKELAAAKEKVAHTNIQTALLDFDVDGALHWVLQKLALRHDGPPTLDTLRAEQEHWYALALNRGLRLEMDLAIALARHNIDVAANDQECAVCQNDLAIALAEQGSRSGGDMSLRLLDDAVIAYRATLKVYTEKNKSPNWATTQNNLGTALRRQGSRSSGDRGIKLLDEAVTAYRAALQVYTKEDMPADWAMTQNNLGAALVEQGARSDGEDGLTLLDDAVKAYRAALEVRTQMDVPVNWAATQDNLGIALQEKGSRSSGDEGIMLLDDAVTAYRAALEVRIRKDMPADWATTQNNLGNALGNQGSRRGGEKGLKLLDDAVTAYRAALEVRTQKDMPANWAATQNNLGTAFRAMAGLHQITADKIPCLEQAIEHYKNALTIYDPDNMPFYYDIANNSLNKAEAELAALRGDGDGSIDA